MSTYPSFNWCGGRVKNQGKFAGKKFTKVQATWEVPAFEDPPKRQTHYAAIFVGLDGGSELLSQNLLQAGVVQIVSTDAAGRTTPDCHAWYLWDPTAQNCNIGYTKKIPSTIFPVDAGDKVKVTLVYKEPRQTAEATFEIVHGPHVGARASSGDFPVDAALFKGDTIEWIMERPANPNSPIHKPRQKLGKVNELGMDNVTLTDAFGWTSDDTKVILTDADALNMEPDDSTDAHPKPTLAEPTLGPNFVAIKFMNHGNGP